MKLRFSRGSNEEGPWWAIEDTTEGEMSPEMVGLVASMHINHPALFWLTAPLSVVKSEIIEALAKPLKVNDEEIDFDIGEASCLL